MIRIAAAGDVHYDRNSSGRFGQHASLINSSADLLLLAGDLTQMGTLEEAEVLAEDLSGLHVPTVAVLGNHDYHSDQQEKVTQILSQSGVTILEAGSVTLQIAGHSVGIVGTKGFGGGFVGACGSDFGEPEMKAFIRHTASLAETIHEELNHLQSEYKIVLLHYSPIADTLTGEKREIYPFLGSYLLAQAIDKGGADIVFHGHAHRGVERGATPQGIPVRNVAQPVIRHAFNIYGLDKEGLKSAESMAPHDAH